MQRREVRESYRQDGENDGECKEKCFGHFKRIVNTRDFFNTNNSLREIVIRFLWDESIEMMTFD